MPKGKKLQKTEPLPVEDKPLTGGFNAGAKEELERTKEDLGDLENYIEEFSSFLPLAVCTVNPIKVIINVNKAFENLAGRDPLEVIGEAVDKIFSEKTAINNLLDDAEKGGQIVKKEFTLVTGEKKKIPVEVSVSLRKDEKDNFIGYFLGIADITESKRTKEELEEKVKERTKDLDESRAALMNILEDAEEARKKSEDEKNKTVTIIRNFSDGLIILGRDNKVSLINAQAEKFFEIKEKNILGLEFSDFSQNPFLFSLADLFKGEIKEIFRKELALKENLVLEITVARILENPGKNEISRENGFLIIAHDITREKTVERMKSEFVSISAHQLRTPLAAIKWTIKMLLDGDVGPLEEKQKEMLEKTYISNERMINLINDLLDVTRIEEGRHIYKFALTDIEPIVKFLFESYKGEAERRKIKFEFKKPPSKVPKVLLDEEKIKLAIQNLIENAIRYTLGGGKVTIALKYDKKEVELTVSDNGIGIPKSQQSRIFTKFFRSDNALRMETEGSGLGLFITKNIIESHKGRIWFESEENKGTTFHFTIPIQKEFEEFLKEF